jgi:hypothetical protein
MADCCTALRLFKTVAVQLPITLIPINSLDVLPNSLAQVAASIEAKRSKTTPAIANDQRRPSFQQGQAFSLPVRCSLDRARQDEKHKSNELRDLTNNLAKSLYRREQQPKYETGNFDGLMVDENVEPVHGHRHVSSSHHLERHPSCYHCQIAPESQTPINHKGPRLPRLQVSTSGLGFSESEFEIAPDTPPRKVMLSEEERNLINRQRELHDRLLENNMIQGRPNVESKRQNMLSVFTEAPRYNNVVADPAIAPKRPDVKDVSPLANRNRSKTLKLPEPRMLLSSESRTLRPSESAGFKIRSQNNPDRPPLPIHRPPVHKPRQRSSLEKRRGPLSLDAPPQLFPRKISKDTDSRASLDYVF